ncbi:hypothetical protein KEM09_03965 [Carboxylicivirga mesophila]|uniref:DUF1735 domain-containing protein n=1 Tax=Carboxylicivirga mesophila TaxID=1166478 RepID=A0ABS5K7Q1_9BACT|nr:hypothetical protein [Carboxylicivirga mesophila]MBS2210541.1 hypothetical protein [Carboxylicivirga mesophila]
MKKMLSSLLVLTILSGCIGDEFDTDLLVDDVNVNAGVAIPLAKTSVTMEDILSDQTDMVKYDGENIILFQENDSLEYVGINDFFRLSASSIDLLVPFEAFNTQPSYEATEELTFSIPNAAVNEMELNYRLSASGSNLEEPLLLTVAIPVSNVPGAVREVVLEVYNGQTTVQSFTGDRISLLQNKVDLGLSVQPLYGGANYSTSMGNVTLTIDELSLNYVKGTMDENQVTMDEGIYELDFDVLKDIPGDIEFADPQLSIIVDNATPFMGEIAAGLSGRLDDGSTMPLSSVPFTIDGADSGEEVKRSRHILTSENSNVSSFIAKTPEQLNYGGILTLNPGGVLGDEVELYDEDRIYIGYGFEVPLELRLNAALDEEVVELGDIDMIDDLTKGNIVITSVNSLPIGASATIDFYEEQSSSIIETMNIDMVKPALVNAEGKVSEAVESIVEVTLTDKQIESLKAASELRVRVQLNTSDYEKGQMVVFQRQNALEMQLGIRGKIEYNN